jgi:hypothetical protein
MDNSDSAAPGLRWLRALVAALLAEIALVAIAAPVFALLADPMPVLNVAIPAASAVVFVLAGYWAALPVPVRGVAQGALAGAWAVVLYLALGVVASLFVEGTSVTDGFTPAYLAAHVLKVVGGAIGGWLVAGKAARPA